MQLTKADLVRIVLLLREELRFRKAPTPKCRTSKKKLFAANSSKQAEDETYLSGATAGASYVRSSLSKTNVVGF